MLYRALPLAFDQIWETGHIALVEQVLVWTSCERTAVKSGDYPKVKFARSVSQKQAVTNQVYERQLCAVSVNEFYVKRKSLW